MSLRGLLGRILRPERTNDTVGNRVPVRKEPATAAELVVPPLAMYSRRVVSIEKVVHPFVLWRAGLRARQHLAAAPEVVGTPGAAVWARDQERQGRVPKTA